MISKLKERLRSIKHSVSDHFVNVAASFLKKPSYNMVDLFYWRPREGINFGDELSRVVVELMLAKKGYTLFDEVRVPRQLIAVGSVLHFAKDGAVVWGSGRNSHAIDDEHRFARLDVRSVRGPRTREFLKTKSIIAPEIYGDPVLLIPMLTHGRFKPTGERDVAFVPNLNDYEAKFDFSKIDIPIIDPRQPWNKVVAEIMKYKFILASSLHGIVVAEAFGIPARYVRLTEVEGLFKYHDYYEGTGRVLANIPTSVSEALKLKGEPPPVVDLEKLVQSFPYDLWN